MGVYLAILLKPFIVLGFLGLLLVVRHLVMLMPDCRLKRILLLPV